MGTAPPAAGEPAPWFTARSPVNPRFAFDTVAGRHVVLCFFASAALESSHRILTDLYQHRDRFDDRHLSFFGVSITPDDERLDRVREALPGMHLFWDFDLQVSRLFGAAPPPVPGADPAAPLSYRLFTLVLDPRLRVRAVFPFDGEPQTYATRLLDYLAALPPPEAEAVPAPVLIVPRIFERELCRELIRYYDDRGGEESGFMRDVEGKTVAVMDYAHKRRRDQAIEDAALRKTCMVRLHDRLAPEIHKAFQFRPTRIERYLVACYDSESGGHFRAHRDNTTLGTAHRRFAVSLNLNAGEYDGGELRFPEFGPQTYCPPAGGAVVFSCSLLHEATPVTRGKRYAFLPFLYDEEAARIREENRRFVADSAAP